MSGTQVDFSDRISAQAVSRMLANLDARTISNYRMKGKLSAIVFSSRNIVYSRASVLNLIRVCWRPPAADSGTPAPRPEDLISAYEVAKMLHVSHRTVAAYRMEDKIGGVYLSQRMILYSRPDVENYISKCYRPAKPQPLLFSES